MITNEKTAGNANNNIKDFVIQNLLYIFCIPKFTSKRKIHWILQMSEILSGSHLRII